MTPLVIAPAAALEIADAARSYEATRPGLGTDFIQHIDTALGNLRQFPHMAAIVMPGFRRIVLHRFPFSVVYRITPAEAQVIAVFPTREDPERLLARLATSSLT